MKHTDLATKVLAVVGTVLVAFPLLAPVLLTGGFLVATGEFRFDWLMPAELALSSFAGGALLLWAAYRAHTRRVLVGAGLAVAVVAYLAVTVFAQVTGLAHGDTEPAGWPLALVLGTYVIYVLAAVELLVAGVMLTVDLYRDREDTAPPAIPAA